MLLKVAVSLGKFISRAFGRTAVYNLGLVNISNAVFDGPTKTLVLNYKITALLTVPKNLSPMY